MFALLKNKKETGGKCGQLTKMGGNPKHSLGRYPRFVFDSEVATSAQWSVCFLQLRSPTAVVKWPRYKSLEADG